MNLFEKMTMNEKPEDIANKNLESFFYQHKVSQHHKTKILELI